MNPELESLGWSPERDAQLLDSAVEGCPARVVRAARDRFIVEGAHSGSARLAGRLDRRDRPVVGDWVIVDVRPGDTLASIVAVLPRRSWLGRRAAGGEHRGQLMAANMDQVWVLCGLDRDQGLRSIQRYLALVRDGGAEPVVVLNKLDLCPDPERARLRAEAVAGDAEVVSISALEGALGGLEARLAAGATFCLVGPSGVGKSTLCNRLAGRVAQATGAVRASDARGRHTTTDRALLRLSGGALLLDTPGLREIGLWLEGDGLERSFQDITALAGSCRFRDCGHDGEPGCAVQEALARGEIPPERFLSWLELEAEARGQRERAAASNSKSRFKEISKLQRGYKKRRRGR
jgi:ribosome biogenesis GTPase